MILNESLKALILVGGKSTRMGEDKFLINYHGEAQWRHLWRLCKDVGLEPVISCNNEQKPYFKEQEVQTIEDHSEEMTGPGQAILQALSAFNGTSFLVLACDIPLITPESVRYLINCRKSEMEATAYMDPKLNLPEPLFAIWEHHSLLNFQWKYESGMHCPQKILMNSDIEKVYPDDTLIIANANTQQERQYVVNNIREVRQ